MENLSQAIKTLEQRDLGPGQAIEKNSAFDFKLAAGRMRSLDPQNCLSCGEPEMMEITNPDGLKGIHMKTVV